MILWSKGYREMANWRSTRSQLPPQSRPSPLHGKKRTCIEEDITKTLLRSNGDLKKATDCSSRARELGRRGELHPIGCTLGTAGYLDHRSRQTPIHGHIWHINWPINWWIQASRNTSNHIYLQSRSPPVDGSRCPPGHRSSYNKSRFTMDVSCPLVP